MKIKLLVEGGSMKPGPAVAQQLGPMGVNLGKVIEDVNDATKGFRGMNVPVELDVDAKTRKYKIEVFSPPMSELIKKELGIEKGSGEPNKTKVGNLALETCIGIAKTKMDNLLARDLKSAVKLVVGTCVSLGVLVDSKEAKEIENDISEGFYDKEIDGEITEPSDKKKKELAAYFAEVKSAQEKTKKAAEEAAAAAEAAKAAAAVGAEAAGGAAEGGEKKETATKKEGAVKKETPAKKEEKK